VVDPSLRPGWPAHLVWGPVELHPPRRRDAEEWSRVRLANEAWLAPWEPTAAGPWAARHTPAAYRAMRRAVLRRAAMGLSLPFVIRVEGRLAGQVTIDNVVRGALRSGNLGYWIDRAAAGRGMASLAVALVCDHAFGPARLHRLQADIRPENGPSRRRTGAATSTRRAEPSAGHSSHTTLRDTPRASLERGSTGRNFARQVTHVTGGVQDGFGCAAGRSGRAVVRRAGAHGGDPR
jgi:ribosomal-protein-alanine N-acetyltransferase